MSRASYRIKKGYVFVVSLAASITKYSLLFFRVLSMSCTLWFTDFFRNPCVGLRCNQLTHQMTSLLICSCQKHEANISVFIFTLSYFHRQYSSTWSLLLWEPVLPLYDVREGLTFSVFHLKFPIKSFQKRNIRHLSFFCGNRSINNFGPCSKPH